MKNVIVYSDFELIDKLIKEKDSKWFGILYDRYASKVYNKCINLTSDKNIAKDLTHDIFIKAFINISRFNKDSAFYTWIYSITYNTCIDYLKKNRRFVSLSSAEDFFENESINEIDDNKLLSISVDRLKVLLEKIPTDDKLILLMKYQDDMTIKEISDFYHIGESATKMRIKRAKKKITELYNIKYRHSTYYLNK